MSPTRATAIQKAEPEQIQTGDARHQSAFGRGALTTGFEPSTKGAT
jgi:hypothetical protein